MPIMAVLARLHISSSTWKARCNRRNGKTKKPTESPESRHDSTASIRANSAGLSLATAQPTFVPPLPASSPISSESMPSSSSSSSSTSSSSSSDDYPSLLPASSSSLLAQTPSSPPSSPTSGGRQGRHITFVSPFVPVAGHIVFHPADRVTASAQKARSQHDYLEEPLRQLLHTCRPRSASLESPYPNSNIANALAEAHTRFLSNLLEVEAKLCMLAATLRQVNAVSTNMLTQIEKEIHAVDHLTRSLRRFEESVKRFLRVEARRSGGGRREVVRKVRDVFSLEMSDAKCKMGLLALQIQCTNLHLVRVMGSSRVPREPVHDR